MAFYGLTGGIGAGKSTVCRFLQELGITVVAADEVGRQVVASGSTGLAAIVATFGDAILDASGALDRRQLGTIVFADAAKRRQLEDIVQPLVKQHSQAIFAELRRSGVPVVVYESALLFETQRHHEMQGTILVVADEAHRIQRVQQRDRSDAAQVRARIQVQMDDTAKRQLASYIVENNGTLQGLRQQVERLVTALRQAHNAMPPVSVR